MSSHHQELLNHAIVFGSFPSVKNAILSFLAQEARCLTSSNIYIITSLKKSIELNLFML